MAIYRLTDELVFPPPEGAGSEGIVAIGGDAAPARLLLAYSQGIFPWPSDGLPLLWFSPDPRFVLDPRRMHIPRTLRKAIRHEPFEIRVDTAFEKVMAECARVPRMGQAGTWITDELRDGYTELHRLGYAHSVEAWENDQLVGGLYGVSLGRAFFGESMFSLQDDASKIATVVLAANLLDWDFDFIDCQVRTKHLERFGATEISRDTFLTRMRIALMHETKRGAWTFPVGPLEAIEMIR